MSRKIFIFVGPSASGKTTVEEELIAEGASRWVVSTTRAKRANEIEGVDYNFLSVEEFKKNKANFLHIIKITEDWLYGYPEPPKSKGAILISIINVEPALKLKKILEEKGEEVYIISFQISKDIRKKLLQKRGDKEKDIKVRFSREEDQAKSFSNFSSSPNLIVKDLNHSLDEIKEFILSKFFKSKDIEYFTSKDKTPEEVKKELEEKEFGFNYPFPLK